jgi:hypothetical protein
MTLAAKLDAAVRAVCPIHGVSIGRPDDKTTWRIDVRDEATAQQRGAAQTALNAFDPAVKTIAELRAETDETELTAARIDATLLNLIDMDPAQIATAIDNAFTDPAQRVILKRICRVLIPTARKVFR